MLSFRNSIAKILFVILLCSVIVGQPLIQIIAHSEMERNWNLTLEDFDIIPQVQASISWMQPEVWTEVNGIRQDGGDVAEQAKIVVKMSWQSDEWAIEDLEGYFRELIVSGRVEAPAGAGIVDLPKENWQWQTHDEPQSQGGGYEGGGYVLYWTFWAPSISGEHAIQIHTDSIGPILTSWDITNYYYVSGGNGPTPPPPTDYPTDTPYPPILDLTAVVQVNPSIALPGNTVLISGSVFSHQDPISGSNVLIEVSGPSGFLEQGQTVSDFYGSFTAELFLPSDASSGVYQVYVVATAEGQRADVTTQFTVQGHAGTLIVAIESDKSEYYQSEDVEISGSVWVGDKVLSGMNVYIMILTYPDREIIDEFQLITDGMGKFETNYDLEGMEVDKYEILAIVDSEIYGYSEDETIFEIIFSYASRLNVSARTLDNSGEETSEFSYGEKVIIELIVTPSVDADVDIEIIGPKSLTFFEKAPNGNLRLEISPNEIDETGSYDVNIITIYSGYENGETTISFKVKAAGPLRVYIKTDDTVYAPNDKVIYTVQLLTEINITDPSKLVLTILYRTDGPPEFWRDEIIDMELKDGSYFAEGTIEPSIEGDWEIGANVQLEGYEGDSDTAKFIVRVERLTFKIVNYPKSLQIGADIHFSGIVLKDGLLEDDINVEILIQPPEGPTLKKVVKTGQMGPSLYEHPGEFMAKFETSESDPTGEWTVKLTATKEGVEGSAEKTVNITVYGLKLILISAADKYILNSGDSLTAKATVYSGYTYQPISDVKIIGHIKRGGATVDYLDGITDEKGTFSYTINTGQVPWTTTLDIIFVCYKEGWPHTTYYEDPKAGARSGHYSDIDELIIPIIGSNQELKYAPPVHEQVLDKTVVSKGEQITVNGIFHHEKYLNLFLSTSGDKRDEFKQAHYKQIEQATVSVDLETISGDWEETFNTKYDSTGKFSYPITIKNDAKPGKYSISYYVDGPLVKVDGWPVFDWDGRHIEHVAAKSFLIRPADPPSKPIAREALINVTIISKDDIWAVAADGISSINLKITALNNSGSPLKNEKVTVIRDYYGQIIDPKTGQHVHELITEDDGSITVKYIAPLGIGTNYKTHANRKGYITESIGVVVAGKTTISHIRVYQPPVILVHGVFSSSDTWKKPNFNMYKALEDAGYDPTPLDYTYSQDMPVSANLIGEWIRDTKKNCMEGIGYGRAVPPYDHVNVTKVNIVAHSLGGVVSRTYTLGLGTGGYNDDVLRLITLGSPHHGASGASWTKIYAYFESVRARGPVWDQLEPDSDFMKSINGDNLNEDRINTDVAHFCIIGNKHWWKDSDLQEMALGQNDGVVTVESAILRNVPYQMMYQDHTTLTEDPVVARWVTKLLNDLTPASKMTNVNVKCPVNIHVYDSKGRQTGKTIDGRYLEQIPGSTMISGEEGDCESIIIFNSEDIYNFVIEGLEEGTFNLTSMFQQNGEYINLGYTNVPATSESTAELKTDSSEYVLELDNDGDGLVDSKFDPDYVDTGGSTGSSVQTTDIGIADTIMGLGILISPIILIVAVVLLIKRRRSKKKIIEKGTPERFCIECGSSISGDAKFCRKCGSKQIGTRQE